MEIEATLPFHLIGSPAEDLASGYKGTISSLSLHINGCLHIAIQAKGTQEDGDKIPELDVDIRRVKGPKVAAFTKGELEKSIKENPSPILYQKYAPALSRPLPKICPQLVK